MRTILTKAYVVDKFSLLVEEWRTSPPIKLPAFQMELWYMDSFLTYIRSLPDSGNIEFGIYSQMEDAWERTFKKICVILDNHSVNGIEIFEFMSEKKFIMRRDRSAYNRQIPGKSPKGLTRYVWEDYNHWIIAQAFWRGFVKSQKKDFRIALPAEHDTDIAKLLSEDYKPLWGIREAFKEVSVPYIGNCGDEINVNPDRSWYSYKKEVAQEFRKYSYPDPH